MCRLTSHIGVAGTEPCEPPETRTPFGRPDDEHRRREFLELVETHGSAIWSMLRRLCRNSADADDAFQETALATAKFGEKPIPQSAGG